MPVFPINFQNLLPNRQKEKSGTFKDHASPALVFHAEIFIIYCFFYDIYDISEFCMKKISFFLFLLLVSVLAAGCSGQKTENDSDTDDPAHQTADEDSSQVPGAPTDSDIKPDEDSAADNDISADKDPCEDEDTANDEDENSDTDADDTAPEDDTDPTDDTDPADDTDSSTALAPTFVVQPEKMNIAPKGRTVSLLCEAKTPGHDVTYQWYESSDGSTDSGTAVPNATAPAFETPVFTEKGIRYYYCKATTVVQPDEITDNEPVSSVSEISSVAYTALPTIYINTPNGVEITSKEEWIENASISIVGAGNESWDLDNTKTSIRGRGNSTWIYPKKPYALKLDKAGQIMGMPKHKRWVLLANYADDTFMKNEAAFYLSKLFELDWTVHGEFADLVLNGRYQGLYWFGEAIKVDKNRVDINDGDKNMTDGDDKDYLVEMDVYYDEILKFKSEIRQMPYMIKNDNYMVDSDDDITSGGAARLERFQTKINDLERLLYPDFTAGMNTNSCSAPDESYSEIIDIDSWSKFWFVNEIMNNQELELPKSVYLTFDSTNNIFKAGPVWDFDWPFTQLPKCQLKDTIYYNALFKSPEFVTRTKEIWNEYRELIDIESVIEAMRNEISTAACYDSMRWEKTDNFNNAVSSLKKNILEKIKIINKDVAGQ